MSEQWRGQVAVGFAAVAVLLAARSSARAEAIVTHIYDLNGTFADALGGPALVPNGGTLGPTGYTYGFGQGPNLSNAINPFTYSIEMLFTMDQTSSFRKLLDFKDRTVDQGIYNFNGQIEFFRAPGDSVLSIPVITAGVPIHLVFTRDGATNQFSVYANGVQRISAPDPGGSAAFTGPDNIIHFLRNDIFFAEDHSGFLDRVRVYDGVLTAEQVVHVFQGGDPTALPTGVIPEPASLTLLGLGGLGLAGYGWRRRAA